MKTITFYSYKGGVGRSLTLSNIAMRLADLGKKVCLIDFDLEAPGLHLKFSEYLDFNKVERGVVEYISEFEKNNYLPEKFDNYLLDINYESKLGGEIKFFPAGNLNSNDYWKNLSCINWKELFYSEKSHGIELLLNLKEKIKQDYNPDFLLIDSRTGITDISGIAMTLLSDTVVTLAANNKENLSGITRVIKSLKNEVNNLTGKLPNIFFVLSRIPYYPKPEDKHKEVRIINKAKNLINKNENLINKVFVIHSDPELEEEERFKINYNPSRKLKSIVPIEEDYLMLFRDLTDGDLSIEDIKKFNRIKEAELLIEEVKETNDNAIKIKKLKKAIELNDDSHEAYSLLFWAYFDLESYDEALEFINKAIELKKDSLNYQYDKATIYFRMDRIEESEKINLEILKKNANHLYALALLVLINKKKGKLKEALSYGHEYVNLVPDSSRGYNSLAEVYRLLNDIDKAYEYVYKALEINPKSKYATGTLAEINLKNNNYQEFYKNLQLSFVFGVDSKDFQRFINDDIYRKVFNDEKFNKILENYRIKVKFPKDK